MKTAKNVKLNPICNLLFDIVNPEKEVVAITPTSLADAGVIETKDAILKMSTRVYTTAAYLATLRESKGTSEEDLELLKVAESNLKSALDAWFTMLGSRDPAKLKETKRRPLYSVTKADYIIIGEVSADARRDVNNDLSKVPESFLNQLIFASVRLVKGEPLRRTTDAEFKAARAKYNATKADKAKATKEANAKKEAETAKKAAETKAAEEAKDKKIAELEGQVADYKAHAIDVAAVVSLINKSHATAEEKQAIIDALYGRSKKAEEKQ